MNSGSLYKSHISEQKVMEIYDSLLAAWEVPHENFFVPTRFGKTHIIASGDTGLPVLILVHGTNSNSAYWMEDIAHYRKFYRVYAIDALGEPGRSPQVRPDWKSPAYYEWMQNAWDALDIKKASLLGLSQGGWIVTKFAISNPQAVDALVLLSPAGIVPMRWSFGMLVLSLLPFKRKGKDKLIKQIFGNQQVPSGILNFSISVLENFQSRKTPMPVFSDMELLRLTMPVLLIGSHKDAIFDARKTAERIRQITPNPNIILLEHAGHSLYGLAEHILPFLLSKKASLVL